MKKCLIAIPSKSRPKEIMIKTLKWLSDENDYIVFVEPCEKHYYKAVIKPNHIYVVEHNNCGLSGMNNEIKQYATKNGYEYILRLDDDVAGIVNPDIKDKNEAFQLFKNDSIFFLDNEPTCGMIGIVNFFNRGTFHALRKNITEGKKFTNRNIFRFSCNIIRTVNFRPLEFMESDDLFYCLDIRSQGLDIYTYGYAYLNHMYLTNKGGLNIDLQKRFAEKMQSYTILKELFPRLEVMTTGKEMEWNKNKIGTVVNDFSINYSFYEK